MCNGPDRSNPPSTSARGGPGGRARGGNGCEGGDGCLRAVLQSLLAALAGLLALLSLPNMFFSRFTTCLRAAAMLAMLSKPHPLLPRGRGRQSQCSCASRPALPWRPWARARYGPVVATRFTCFVICPVSVCAIGTSLWSPLHHHPCNGLHAALTLQWIACCSYPKSPNRRGSPSGAETSGGPRHSLVTPGQGVSRVTFG